MNSKVTPVVFSILTREENARPTFQPQPSIVRVEFDQLNTKVKTSIKLTNVSDGPHRLHILPTKSPNWKVSYQKKGRISAGMSEEVQIEFIGREYRKYEESFTVITERSKFSVPMEAVPAPTRVTSPTSPIDAKKPAFGSLHLQDSNGDAIEETPSQNNLIFPTRIDFGKCILHQKYIF